MIIWSIKEIYYSKLDNNGNVLVDNKRITANTFSSERPIILVDGNDYVNILLLDDRDCNFNIYYKKIDDNGNFILSDKKLTSDIIVDFDAALSSNVTAIVYQT